MLTADAAHAESGMQYGNWGPMMKLCSALAASDPCLNTVDDIPFAFDIGIRILVIDKSPRYLVAPIRSLLIKESSTKIIEILVEY